MIEVRVRDNTPASFEKAIRVFKKLCKEDGFIDELKNRQYFISEGQKKREKKRKKGVDSWKRNLK